jgi:hypothetical protein
MTDERSRQAIELNERFADGRATDEERSKHWLHANTASCQARQTITYPEEAGTQAFATAAEAAELTLAPLGDWLGLKISVSASAAALAYDATAQEDLPPAQPWPGIFSDEDAEAVAWVTRYESFRQTPYFLVPYRNERAAQAELLRSMLNRPLNLAGNSSL